jgi:hypothetical protein
LKSFCTQIAQINTDYAVGLEGQTYPLNLCSSVFICVQI